MHAPDNILKVLVANKSDMCNREVSTDEGCKLADSINMKYFQTSAKENKNIEDVFKFMANYIKDKQDEDSKSGVLGNRGNKIIVPIDKVATEKCC